MKRAALFLVAFASPALAHGRETSNAPGWSFDPWLVVPLLALLLAFLIGFVRLWGRSDLGRTALRKSAALFLSGWSVLALAMLSPLHEGGERSFTLHMIEHELIMLVASLLLAASTAGGMLAWGLPGIVRQKIIGGWHAPLSILWRRLTEPVTATLLQAVAMWAWHAPGLFDLALEHRGWHIAQHLSFLVTSFLFWWAMFQVRGDRSRFGLSAACLFVTSLVGGGLGALMALSASPWYAPYAQMQLSGIGLDPVTDQQLAGLLMWIPGGIVHAGAALYCLYRWMTAAGERNALFVR
jgi:putative membrane protein